MPQEHLQTTRKKYFKIILSGINIDIEKNVCVQMCKEEFQA